jgi:hypothetical protein
VPARPHGSHGRRPQGTHHRHRCSISLCLPADTGDDSTRITRSFLFLKEESSPTESYRTPPDSRPQNTTIDNSSVDASYGRYRLPVASIWPRSCCGISRMPRRLGAGGHRDPEVRAAARAGSAHSRHTVVPAPLTPPRARATLAAARPCRQVVAHPRDTPPSPAS